jgi:FkbM family methyltransferase
MQTPSVQPARRPLSHFLPAPLRAVLRHPRIEPRVVAVLRSRIVHESPRFAARELDGRTVAHVYRIRESGLKAMIVHGSSDAASLDQAYYERAHEPPAGALEVLGALDRPPRALDLGANIGLWGLWLHGRFPGARVTALEPDPENVARHRRQIELNELGHSWKVIEAAATTSDGPVSFTVGRATTGSIVEGDAPGTASVTGLDAFGLLEDVDLLKVDIEGSEWELLADPRLSGLRVPVVMLEYHARGAPDGDPVAFVESALRGAGYRTEKTIESGPGFGVVWGWKTGCE